MYLYFKIGIEISANVEARESVQGGIRAIGVIILSASIDWIT